MLAAAALAEAGEVRLDGCPRAAEHSGQLLGKTDNGKWAWRCGNCLEVRECEGEGGGSDPFRANDSVVKESG